MDFYADKNLYSHTNAIFSASEKIYNVAMATAYMAYDEISKRFDKCSCRSMALQSMYINYTNMSKEERAAVRMKISKAMKNCTLIDTGSLQAQVKARKKEDHVILEFSTMGYGKITAVIDGRGDIKIAS